MKKINLILGIHNHQPIGNFESVFERAFDQAYSPFVELLERYPAIKVTQHYTGILLDWFTANRPGFLKQLKALVRRGQVEMMGGAYYEPILSIIPDDDKRGQIEKLSADLENTFGVRPTGMWLAERVWEQHLTKFIADAGLKFIAVDDTHFKYAGLSDYELLGYYMTEEQGSQLAAFPISKKLRYTIPFQPVQKTLDYLREIATEEGDRIVVYADDGEKFGVWPKTYKHVYGDRWLEDFFRVLSDNREWIRILHFSEALQQYPAVGRIYLPNASYAEMMQWVLRPRLFSSYEEIQTELKKQGKFEKYEPYFKGGFWRNFLVKYPEINSMHKKMLRVSQRLRHSLQTNKASRSKLEYAAHHLWAAQCNDPYWHGVFGGFYLPVLRYPIFKNLIDTERQLDAIEKRTTVNIERTDFDCDGREEVIVETPSLNCYLKPDLGGSIFELDFKSISLNLLDVVTRREEGYHKKLAQANIEHAAIEGAESIHDLVLSKEEGLERFLHYDWYRRGSLIDHFFGFATTLEQVQACNYPELGDFVNQPYETKTAEGEKGKVELVRRGAVWNGEIRHGVEVRKTITFRAKESKINVAYSLKNLETRPVDLWFGVEFNVGLQAGDTPDRYYYADDAVLNDRRLRSAGELTSVKALGLRDEWLGVDVRVESDKPATFWRFPIETVSLSEEGFERIFQSSVVIPQWRFRLEKQWQVKLVHSFNRLKKGTIRGNKGSHTRKG